ncbi:ArsR/SmtB family transcription factor [Sanguibacter biliveldensis]|uniref:ArsR/SmtB family transcription factor n=1 Tax=Sanguibacter biliveldensis TaxID=3030830 RepID=UPI0038CD7498
MHADKQTSGHGLGDAAVANAQIPETEGEPGEYGAQAGRRRTEADDPGGQTGVHHAEPDDHHAEPDDHRVQTEDHLVELAVEVFAMFADATRLRIVLALRGGELPVNDIAQAVGKSPSAVSQHLAKLRMARLVSTRQDGTRVFYRLTNEHVRELVTDAIYQAEHVAEGFPRLHHHAAESPQTVPTASGTRTTPGSRPTPSTRSAPGHRSTAEPASTPETTTTPDARRTP